VRKLNTQMRITYRPSRRVLERNTRPRALTLAHQFLVARVGVGIIAAQAEGDHRELGFVDQSRNARPSFKLIVGPDG
jgi:hypothetical protein